MLIGILTCNSIINIFKEVNTIFNFEYKQIKNNHNIIDEIFKQKFKHIIIEFELINYDFNIILELKQKLSSNIIVIIDEYYFKIYKDKLINNNITDIVINYSNTQIKKELIQILHNPNNHNITQIINKPTNLTTFEDNNKQIKNKIISDKTIKAKVNAKAFYLVKKHQKKLKKRYKVNDDNVMLVEKKNFIKTISDIFIKVFKVSLNILIFSLATVGLISIIYPASRNNLFEVFNSFINELNLFF